MFTSVVNLVTDTVTGALNNEDLKKLIQPRSLVAAAIFLALNMALIYPALLARRATVATETEALPTSWQLGLGVLLLFALSYLLNSLEGYFLNLTSGSALRDSPVIGRLLLGQQRRTFRELQKALHDAAPLSKTGVAPSKSPTLTAELPTRGELAKLGAKKKRDAEIMRLNEEIKQLREEIKKFEDQGKREAEIGRLNGEIEKFKDQEKRKAEINKLNEEIATREAGIRRLREEQTDQEHDDGSKQEQEKVVARAAYRLAYEYPRDPASVAPTRLGNAMLSASSYTLHQYGAHLDTLWPIMELVLKEKGGDFPARLRDSRADLAFLSSLAVLLSVVAVEVWMVRGLWRREVAAWVIWVPLLLVTAYIVYQAAVQKAKAWSRDVRLAFDLYLDEVAVQLGLHPLPPKIGAHIEKRHARWENLSRWLSLGAIDPGRWARPVPDPGWYAAPPDTPPAFTFTVEGPPTVRVQPHRWAERRGTERTTSHWVFGPVVDYLLTVTNEQQGEAAHPAYNVALVVSDTTFPKVPEVVPGVIVKAGGDGIPMRGVGQPGLPPSVLWQLGTIAAWGSETLRYSLPLERDMWTIKVQPETIIIREVRESTSTKETRLCVKVYNSATEEGDVTITVTAPAFEHLTTKATWGLIPSVQDPCPPTETRSRNMIWKEIKLPFDKEGQLCFAITQERRP